MHAILKKFHKNKSVWFNPWKNKIKIYKLLNSIAKIYIKVICQVWNRVYQNPICMMKIISLMWFSKRFLIRWNKKDLFSKEIRVNWWSLIIIWKLYLSRKFKKQQLSNKTFLKVLSNRLNNYLITKVTSIILDNE